MTDVFEWLEASDVAVYIRQSSILYPVIEIVHIIGFIFLTGSAFLFDFRLLGVSKNRLSVSALAKHLLPWSRRSLLLVIPSGMLLFISDAKSLSTNNVFGVKLVLILFALTNAAFFHVYTFRTVDNWDHRSTVPVAARTAGIISLILWIAVITCGRLIAYFD